MEIKKGFKKFEERKGSRKEGREELGLRIHRGGEYKCCGLTGAAGTNKVRNAKGGVENLFLPPGGEDKRGVKKVTP